MVQRTKRRHDMTGHRVATKLSQELAQVDRGIRIGRLKAQVAALSGGTMVDCSGEADENSAVVESFWEQVLLFESAELGTNFAQLEEAGMQLPPADSLTDTQLHAKLWEVIQGLAKLQVFLSRTDHLSDRELYIHLWGNVLREETEMMAPDPRSAYHVDILGGCSDEDLQTSLKYYDDEAERDYWHDQFPNDPIPDHEDLPYCRDRDLPKWEYA
jgi:hypothetical protein